MAVELVIVEVEVGLIGVEVWFGLVEVAFGEVGNVVEVEAETGVAATVAVGDLEVVVAAVGVFVGLVVIVLERVVELLTHLDCYKNSTKISKISIKTRHLHWWSRPHWRRLQSHWCLSRHHRENTNWLIDGLSLIWTRFSWRFLLIPF